MADATYNLNGDFKLTMRRFADLDGPDFFPTPRWTTFALIDNENSKATFRNACVVMGPCRACLKKLVARSLAPIFNQRGYGEAGRDFLKSTRYADNIVTNPAYNCAEGFVAGGVKLARRKFALLLRLAFLEGANFGLAANAYSMPCLRKGSRQNSPP